MVPGNQPRTTRSDRDQNDPPVSQEELDIIRERMKTFDQDRKVARPADEVMERLLRRRPEIARQPPRAGSSLSVLGLLPGIGG